MEVNYNIVLVLPYINMNPPQIYTCSPSWTSLPPPSPYRPSGSSPCTSPKHPVSCIEPGLVIHFIYDIIHVSMPFSQIIPPSHSPTESKRLFYTSVSLLLSHIQGYHYHLSKFHIYALVYCIGFAIHWHESTMGVTWVPNPETPSHLSPRIISLGHPSAPAPSLLYPVSNLDWWFVSYMTVYMLEFPFSQIIPPSHSPSESKSPVYTSVSFFLSCIQGRHCHLPKFHIYVLVYCIGVFLSGLLHSV